MFVVAIVTPFCLKCIESSQIPATYTFSSISAICGIACFLIYLIAIFYKKFTPIAFALAIFAIVLPSISLIISLACIKYSSTTDYAITIKGVTGKIESIRRYGDMIEVKAEGKKWKLIPLANMIEVEKIESDKKSLSRKK